MSSYPFNKAEEFKAVGRWPDLPDVYGMPVKAGRKFNTPITPRENFQRMIRKEKPLWIPNLLHDFNFIQPQAMPDAFARVHGGTDWFGIEWEYEKLTNAAMVKPGTRRLSDVTAWEKEIVLARSERHRLGKGFRRALSIRCQSGKAGHVRDRQWIF